MESSDESRKNISCDGSKTSLFGKSPVITRRTVPGGEQGKSSSVNTRLRHLFTSDNSVISSDLHVPADDSLNTNDSYMTSIGSSSAVGNLLESSTVADECDSHGTVDIRRTKAAHVRLQNKIHRTLQLIQVEQTAKEDNVNEYLRLSGAAGTVDKQQVQRVKSAFERKNQKSTQVIERLQRKLEDYQRRLLNVDTYGVSTHKQAKDLLKDVGQGLKEFFVREPVRSREASPSSFRETSNVGRDTASGFSGSLPLKSKETPAPVLKHQYGSADNITQKTRDSSHFLDERGDKHLHHGNGLFPSVARGPSDEDDSSAISDSVASAELAQPSPRHLISMDLPLNTAGSVHESVIASASVPTIEQRDIAELLADLHESQQQYLKLKMTVEGLKSQLETENLFYRQALDEERDRCERLEDQINDLTELHQHEVTNIKQELAGMQEKMEYQLEERTRDMQELLESCQTKITKMELQQQQQQLISMEGIENSNFRAVLTKLINVMLALLAVVLVTVSTVASLLAPFLTSRLRIVSTAFIVVCIVFIWQNWPVVCDILDLLVELFYHRTSS